MADTETLFFDFEIVHKSGDRLYPARIENSAGQNTFRWFTRGNLNCDSFNTSDPNEAVNHFLGGDGVRCSTRNGSRKGIYRLNGRAFVRFIDKRKTS